ncbi:hypothetical protein PCASD_16643 [Puccinia coronata f. sp. avenae]|uniref:Uncharacterized protein n=1 Tax=Puccinia coronata f. sp. avenae TaxID=200324 RepID=A0A2N5T3S3_9BASI|nr:hypothetical protein PCASD_16643 [Puccinia coronata f. sp. avenae]
MFIEASRQLHRLVGALDAGNVSATPAEFIYSSRFKTFCCVKIRKILTTGNVDSYTTNSTTKGMPISCTALTHIDSQEDQWMREYLPSGYPDLPSAQVSLLGQMRLLIKHDCGLVHNFLLTNIKELNCHPITGPVPTLDELIVLVDHGVASPARLCSVASIRLAYGGTGKRQTISSPSFSKVVIERDATSFNGTHQIEQIAPDLIHLPTNVEVQAYMDQVAVPPTATPDRPGNLHV